jgi:hypothetical protein
MRFNLEANQEKAIPSIVLTGMDEADLNKNQWD